MEARLENFLACPVCKADVSVQADLAVCRGCARTWPVEDGLPRFVNSPATYHYDFEYTREGMDLLLHRAETEGWNQALRTSPNNKGELPTEYFLQYNSSGERAPWVDLLAPGPDRAVLDFGCGMGAISSALAQRFGTVVSFDASFNRARFWDTRRRQEGLANACVFSWDGLGDPPLKPASFDAVVLNGVLEWVPESVREGDPRNVQVEALRKLLALLKPGGRLYLAIENRFAGRYLIGHRDHHSHLRFATVLPRALADLYSRKVRGQPFRVYTYSLAGYRRLLRDAGFNQVEFYDPYPRYMFPRELIPLRDQERLAEVRQGENDFESVLVRLLSRVGLADRFVFTYAMVASK